MNARAAILNAVRAVELPSVDLPENDPLSAPLIDMDVVRAFVDASRATGADVLETDAATLGRHLETIAFGATRVLSVVGGMSSTLSRDADVGELARVEVFVCEAVLGVSENGAVWLPRSRLGPRAAVFLAEHVVVLVKRSTLVRDLHEAYERIDAGAESFGVFVAGPSKTADIEQSLVIGAHGPKRLTVILT